MGSGLGGGGMFSLPEQGSRPRGDLWAQRPRGGAGIEPRSPGSQPYALFPSATPPLGLCHVGYRSTPDPQLQSCLTHPAWQCPVLPTPCPQE